MNLCFKAPLLAFCAGATLMMAGRSPGRCAPTLPADRYYAVLVNGKAAGYDHYALSPIPGGMKVTSDSLIKISAMGAPLDVTEQGVAEYIGTAMLPKSYALTVSRANNPTTFRMTFHNNTVDYTSISGGATNHKTVPIKLGTLLAGGVDSWESILRKAPPKADSYSVTIFDPQQGLEQNLKIIRAGVGSYKSPGAAIACDKWATSVPSPYGPQAVTFLVSRIDKRLLAMEIPDSNVGFHLADKRALHDFGTFDFTSRAFATVDTPLHDPSSLDTLKLRVAAQIGLEKPTLASLQRPTQAFTGTAKGGVIDGVFTIHPARYDGKNAPAYPYSSAVVDGQSGWLKPSDMAQSGDPRIKTLAKTLTAHATDGWEAVSQIGHWVSSNIQYQLTGSDALQCLNSRSGDCGPHTWLTIALCRAAGIPARIVGGALYTAALGGSYGQHYWTEVWMGPRAGWIPIDTTIGEIGPLSPAHLTLWHLGAMKSLSVKVIDYSPKTIAKPAEPALATHANGLAAGYKESYVFTIDGKNVGTQTAELAKVDGDRQTWNFALNLSIPHASQPITLKQTGTLVVTATDEPVSLDAVTSAQGSKQTVSESFKNGSVAATVTLGTMSVPHTVPLDGQAFLCLGNVLTTWSLATRSVGTSPEKPFILPMFFGDALQQIKVTFSPTGAETLQSGGKSVACHVYSTAPIGGSAWLADSTGELLKVTDPRQKLEIVRQ